MLLVQFLGSLDYCMPGNADGIVEKQLVISLEETGSAIVEYAGKQYIKKNPAKPTKTKNLKKQTTNKKPPNTWLSWKKVSDLPSGQ